MRLDHLLSGNKALKFLRPPLSAVIETTVKVREPGSKGSDGLKDGHLTGHGREAKHRLGGAERFDVGL